MLTTMVSLLAKLEDMVSKTTIAADDDDTNTASDSATRRWRKLFGFTRGEAAAKIEEWRRDWKRKIVSQELWEEIREEMERDDFDKESYEFSLSLEGFTWAWLRGLPEERGDAEGKNGKKGKSRRGDI